MKSFFIAIVLITLASCGSAVKTMQNGYSQKYYTKTLQKGAVFISEEYKLGRYYYRVETLPSHLVISFNTFDTIYCGVDTMRINRRLSKDLGIY